jgi:hypothetical protein
MPIQLATPYMYVDKINCYEYRINIVYTTDALVSDEVSYVFRTKPGYFPEWSA